MNELPLFHRSRRMVELKGYVLGWRTPFWTVIKFSAATGHVSTVCKLLLNPLPFPTVHHSQNSPSRVRMHFAWRWKRVVLKNRVEFWCLIVLIHTNRHTPPTHPFDLIVRRRSVAVVMMMMMCLESNRHGNVATVSDAAAEDWRKWQTFDTSFPFFVLLIFLRRTRPVPPFSGAVVFPCLVMFERVFFSAVTFLRMITTFDGWRKLVHSKFSIGKCKPVRSFFVYSFWREISGGETATVEGETLAKAS